MAKKMKWQGVWICNENTVKRIQRRLDHFEAGRENLRQFFSQPWQEMKNGRQNHSLHWFQRTRGKKWPPSVVVRTNKGFSAVEPTTRDKCLTEGYSPGCMILMICSRHTAISLVVHEALWQTEYTALLVRTICCRDIFFPAGHNLQKKIDIVKT